MYKELNKLYAYTQQINELNQQINNKKSALQQISIDENITNSAENTFIDILFNFKEFISRMLFNKLVITIYILVFIIRIVVEPFASYNFISVLIIPIIIPLALLGIGSIINQIKNNHLDKYHMSDLYRQKVNDFDKNVSHQKKLIQSLETEKDIIYRNINKSDLLPEKYKTIHAIQTIYCYFLDRRADSLKEAYNLYEQEKRDNAILDAHLRNASVQEQMHQDILLGQMINDSRMEELVRIEKYKK